MRNAQKQSLYGKMVGRRQYEKQAEPDFLRACDISKKTDAARIAVTIRRILSDYSNPSVCPDEIVSDYTLRHDLEISMDDSLNLLDVINEIETALKVELRDDQLREIDRLYRSNATVKEFVDYFTAKMTFSNPA